LDEVARDPWSDVPEGAQVNQEEWRQFLDFAGSAHIRGAVKILSHLPSSPRCEACGGPFGGPGGRIMKAVGRGPSRKNPRWCNSCFEKSPEGGFVGTVGVLFADVRRSTELGERLPPGEVAALLNEFYDRASRVIVRHGIVDKLIGDEVMGIYLPALTPGGRLVDTIVDDARRLLDSIGYGTPDGPILDVGIGLDVGPAYVGHVGGQGIEDFTAIGDVVNTAARLQGRAGAGEIVMPEAVAVRAGLGPDSGAVVQLDLKGKSEPLQARVLTGASARR
jgi:adenylate cyclase